MLLCAELHIYSDHMNILHVGDSSEQRLRLISYVDEYGPNIHHIEGPRNVIADTFSKLLRKDAPSTLVGKKATHIVSDSELKSLYLSLIDYEEILQCFLNLPCCLFNNEKEERPKKCRKYSAIYFHWHIMDTIILVIPMLSIAISTSLRTWLKTVPWI